MNKMSLHVQNQIKRTGSLFSVNANGGGGGGGGGGVRSPAGAGGEQRGGNIEGGSGMVHAVSGIRIELAPYRSNAWKPCWPGL